MCAFTPSDRKIEHTMRSTCVFVRKLREATRTYALLSRFRPKDRKIGRTVSSFEIFYFELLDPENLTSDMQNIFGENVDPKTVYTILGHKLRESTRMRFY